MDILITQTELIKELEKRGIQIHRSTLKEHCDNGVVPFHIIESKSTKRPLRRFDLDEVYDTLRDLGLGKSHNVSEIKTDETEITTLAQANTFKSIYQGKLPELNYRLESGELVERDKVEDTAFKVARIVRDKLLTLPERLSNELAAKTNAHEIKELLYSEIGMALEGLSENSLYED
jgi:hypothetical protein